MSWGYVNLPGMQSASMASTKQCLYTPCTEAWTSAYLTVINKGSVYYYENFVWGEVVFKWRSNCGFSRLIILHSCQQVASNVEETIVSWKERGRTYLWHWSRLRMYSVLHCDTIIAHIYLIGERLRKILSCVSCLVGVCIVVHFINIRNLRFILLQIYSHHSKSQFV